MQGFTARFLADENGATAIEYAFIALFVGVALIAGLSLIGGPNGGVYNDVMGRIGAAMDVF